MAVNILNLPDWRVIEVRETNQAYEIHAEYEPEPAVCPRCGVVGPSVYRHGRMENTFADLPHHGRRTVIVVHRTRFKCRECGKTFLELLPAMSESHHATKRMVTWIEQQALRRPFTQVSRDLSVSEATVRRIFAEFAKRLEARRSYALPTQLGIDEIHLLGKPRCVLTDLGRGAILDIMKDRTKAVIIPGLQRYKGLDRVQVVSIDMWRPYKDVVNTLMPQAAVVVDKFHVLRMATSSMEAVRKSVRRGLNSRQRVQLKNDRFILLRRGSKLKPTQRMILEAWGGAYPQLVEAYRLKEAFYDAYDATTKEEARERFRAWSASVPHGLRSYFRPPLSVLKNWEEEIVAYWDHPVTNAYTEGINSVIRMTNRLGRGYSFEVLRAKSIYTPPGWYEGE